MYIIQAIIKTLQVAEGQNMKGCNLRVHSARTQKKTPVLALSRYCSKSALKLEEAENCSCSHLLGCLSTEL